MHTASNTQHGSKMTRIHFPGYFMPTEFFFVLSFEINAFCDLIFQVFFKNSDFDVRVRVPMHSTEN